MFGGKGKDGQPETPTGPSEEKRVQKTEEEWKKQLSRKEYHVLREKGTERAGSGEYNKFYPKEGHFQCAACGNPLYSAQAKFDSGYVQGSATVVPEPTLNGRIRPQVRLARF